MHLFDINRIDKALVAAAAKSVLVIHGEEFGRRVLSVGGDSKVKEFEMQYQVQYSLLQAGGNPLLSQEKLLVARDLRFNENTVLAKAQEERQRQSDMVADAARQILRRLEAINPTKEKAR